MALSASKSTRLSPIEAMMNYSDMGITILVVVIIAMMVIPLPTGILDILLALNITFAVVVLLMTFYVKSALEIAAFPSILLIATLFRLALNVSTTRLILLNGFAGKLIGAFGAFVVGGNYVVGGVVFLILVLIQFLVITKGAERVAEVQARFQLDGMPGKQMAIDADLGNGLIDEPTARVRRRIVQREADFFGAMDGASKFVKGDAIAGLLITTINIIGGISIGTFQQGLSLNQAVQRFSLLTVGDGLVAQIPALILSTATGILVTRSAGESNLGRDIGKSLLAYSRPLLVGSGLLFFLSLVPGFPRIPFIILSMFLGLQGYWVSKEGPSEKEEQGEQIEAHKQAAPQGPQTQDAPARGASGSFDSAMKLLAVDPLELEVGYALIPLVEASKGGDLLDRIQTLRRQMAMELGVVTPPVRIKDNLQLKPSAYVIKVRGVPEKMAELVPDQYLAIDTGNTKGELVGIPTREPSFGLDAFWIAPEIRNKAENLGYTVVDAPSVLATHLSEVVRANAADLLTRQTVQNMVDIVREGAPAVVEEMLQNLSLGDVQKVLQNLVREKVPIRDLAGIFETLADYGRSVQSFDFLSERAREGLKRVISSTYVSEETGELTVVTLSPEWEKKIKESVQGNLVEGWRLKMDTAEMQLFIKAAGTSTEAMLRAGLPQIILCHPDVRLYVRKITEKAFPNVAVLGYNEIGGDVKLKTIGVVDGSGA
ncbi:MAG TPA: flagellar biosynthesis protein FlhA [Synergistales bacterium]|nr:flagellar biosynthesis protein FlhA [Synergistales bacterium]HRV71107.1 flagellar biosynthesis protein FlhA [Thermovirgaceae bacterium]